MICHKKRRRLGVYNPDGDLKKKKKEKKKVVVSHISSIDHVNEKHVTHISTSANELS